MADRTRSDHEITEVFDGGSEGEGTPPRRPDGSSDTVPDPGAWSRIGDDDELANGSEWSHYRIVGFLGQGGMGVVYRAQDLTLDRDVALKFLRGDDPQLVQRFFREARAQARLDHEGICNVYEAGEHDGKAYIAMQFLDGKVLGELGDELTVDHKVRLMAQVADAVAAAHSQGLVHRDLKPSNVMVVQTDDGELRPYVMDFGLVRDESAPDMTATGATLGTPAYMAPEQARGDTHLIDRRTDVYSLGATLHDLLLGQPPFPETNPVRQIIRVLEEEPVPLRQHDAHIPADIETIALRCLEKDPAARYPSARALADELRRYLDGEPIEARPISALARLLRRARKQQALWTVVAVAVVVVLLAGAVSLRVRWQATREAELAQEFGQAAADIEWALRVAHMSPLHDVTGERDQVRQRMDDVRARMDEVGRLGEGPGYYALGRGHLELGEPDEARENLERAWEAGYQSPEVAHALGSAYGMLYEREIQAVRAIPDAELRASRHQAVQDELREPTLRYLKASEGAELAAPEILAGRIALYEGRYDEALEKAREAAGRQAWLYEARMLEGAVFQAMAAEAHLAGQWDESLQRLADAVAAYQAAVEVGQSDAAAHEGLCLTWLDVMRTRSESDPSGMERARDAALEACDDALVAQPDRVSVHIDRAEAWRMWGHHQQNAGSGPYEAYDKALEAVDRALALDPERVAAHTSRGTTQTSRANFQLNYRGADPTAALDDAIESYGKAAELDPTSASSSRGLGIAYRTRAKHLWDTGGDPNPAWASSIEAYERSLALDPSQAKIHNHLGGLYADRACYRNEHGMDGGPDLEKAVDAFQLAVERNPHDSYSHLGVGATYYIRAEIELQKGIDPRPSVASCVQGMSRAIEIKPSWDYPHFAIGFAHYIAALYEIDMGEDPTPSLAKARDAYAVSVELNAGSVDNWLYLAEAELVAAEYALLQGQSPEPALAEVERCLGLAQAIDPDSSHALRQHADVALLRARSRMAAGRSPAEQFRLAEADFARALEANPTDAWVLTRAAALHWYRATWSLAAGRPVADDLDAGLALARRSREANAHDAEALALEGALLLLDSREGAHRDGETAIRRAVEMNPMMQREYGALL